MKICRVRSGRDLRQIDRGRHSSAHLHVCALSSTHEYEVCTSSSLLTLLSLSGVCFKVDHNRCGQLCLVIAHYYLPAAYHHLPQTHRNLAYCTHYSHLLPLSWCLCRRTVVASGSTSQLASTTTIITITTTAAATYRLVKSRVDSVPCSPHHRRLYLPFIDESTLSN